MISNSTVVEEYDALLDLRQDLLDNPYPLYHRMQVEAPDHVAISRPEALHIEAGR